MHPRKRVHFLSRTGFLDSDSNTEPFDLERAVAQSKSLKPGSEQYRAYVGPPMQYDFMGATQFRLLTGLGLREEHRLLDLGCGSLRAGRYLINYLLPDRYVGVEPNAWLWQDALAREIGQDLVALKRPVFVSADDFSLPGIAPESLDFAVAQSIYSHTGADAFETSLAAVAACLKPGGQFLFTVLSENTPLYGKIQFGRDVRGWIYPPVVAFPEEETLSACSKAGLHGQRLDWYHPRQTWYRATRDAGLRLTPAMQAQLGSGRPLFDDRFAEETGQ